MFKRTFVLLSASDVKNRKKRGLLRKNVFKVPDTLSPLLTPTDSVAFQENPIQELRPQDPPISADYEGCLCVNLLVHVRCTIIPSATRSTVGDSKIRCALRKGDGNRNLHHCRSRLPFLSRIAVIEVLD